MSTFFTADTHFGHKMLIDRGHRPFASVEEMDEVMIERWNRAINPIDTVWHLGDFNFRSKRLTGSYRACLNGNIHLVLGNHDDRYAKKFPLCFASIQNAKYLRVHGVKITLYHYAQRVWRNSHHGSYHLFGHSHGALPSYHRSMDVGVDAHNFMPVSFDEIHAYMETQPVTLHHPMTAHEGE